MTIKDIAEQLETIVSAEDVVSTTAELTEAWSAANLGIESIQFILRFMEEHPELDFGSPGPLIQFIEILYLNGYEEYEQKLIESVSRRPTTHTVWMLNRVLNITKDPKKRQALLRAMRQAACNPKIDKATLAGIQVFLE